MSIWTLIAVVTASLGVNVSTAAAATNPRTPAAARSASVENCPRIPGRKVCLSVRVPIEMTAARAGTTTMPAALTAYGPADLAAAYKIPASRSTATVAIVDAYDAPTAEADLAKYRSYYRLPACTTANGCFRKVNQSGRSTPLPARNDDWAAETTLDVEMISAVCPTCHILLVESNDDDRSGHPNMEAAVKTATNLGARFVSMSWGGPELSTETTADRTYFNVPGVTYVAASGDWNYGTSWPAVNPNVVSVGGTTLLADKSPRGWDESVWGYDDGTGTGSGCSAFEAIPAWQKAVSAGLCAGRAMNDVSIVGDPNTGVATYQSGSWFQYGGTSVGAPLIAAMYAMTGGATAASPASYPYAHRSSFNDVTRFANGYCGSALCIAVPGWDGPSGVGTPIGLSGFAAPVVPQRVSIHNPGTVSGYAGAAVAVDVRATDTAHLALRYSATGLPPGTSVSPNGMVSGAPQVAGAYTAKVTARDTAGNTATTTFHWNVVSHSITTAVTPHISGVLQHGRVVTASYAPFRADTAKGALISPSSHLQWYSDGRAIAGAVRSSFTIPATYRGHRLAFTLTASATYYRPYSYTTPSSGPIS